MSKHYLLTEQQKDLQALVREFAQKEIAPHAAEWDKNSEIPREYIEKGFELGLHLTGIPEKYGGMGLDTVTRCIIREELGKADAGYAITLGASLLGYLPIALAGNEEQLKRVVDIIVPGNVCAFCLTEPGGGSDAAMNTTTARKVGDEYIINGRKCFITNGALAGVYTVFASTDKSKGAKGISAFIVERDREGITVGKKEDKMGIRSSNTTDVIFEEVRVPAKNLIGGEGQGFKIAMQTLDRTRAEGSATGVGICQAAIDHCVKYAKERVVFGKPIGRHQAISFMLADMEIQTQAARQLVLYTARLADNGIIDGMISACAKTFVGDTAMKVTTDAVQIFGGYGYCKDYPVEKLMRDAKVFQIFEGTNQIQRLVISGNMLK